MRVRKHLVGCALIIAACLSGCGDTQLVILHQSLDPSVKGGWTGAVLAPLDAEDPEVATSLGGAERTTLLRTTLEQTVLARTGIHAGDGHGLSPGWVVVRPTLSKYDPASTKEILHLHVRITTADGAPLDEIVLRDTRLCAGDLNAGEPGGPGNAECAVREIDALAVRLSNYLRSRGAGQTHRPEHLTESQSK